MIFKGPGGFGRIVNIIMNLILCSVLSVYVLWTVQNIPGNEMLPILTPLGFFVSLVSSFGVGYTIGDLVPGYQWGQALAAKLGVKSKIPAHLVASLIHDIVMVTLISFIMTWINNVQTIGMEGVIQSWLMVYPFLFVAAYLIIAIFLLPCFSLAAKISGFDPNAAPPMPAPDSASEVQVA